MNNQSEALSTSYDKFNHHKSNIITKINIIKEGINFIVPSFWYHIPLLVGIKNLNNSMQMSKV